VLILRQLRGPRDAAELVLAKIAAQGVPNYFGPQRFGRDASNLRRAARFLAGEGGRPKPEQKRMLLSAARSYLFNRVLAERVRRGDWNQAVPGEVMLLDGSNRQFLAESPDEEIRRRVREHDIHPSGPLPGRQGRTLAPLGTAARLEQEVLAEAPGAAWIDALVRQGADSERRPLRLVPADLAWKWLAADALQLTFSLPAGAFGTTLVRELMVQAALPGEPARRDVA
jgi:tRNA pseudouridine13 synthase